jgi:hypothetical protein
MDKGPPRRVAKAFEGAHARWQDIKGDEAHSWRSATASSEAWNWTRTSALELMSVQKIISLSELTFIEMSKSRQK